MIRSLAVGAALAVALLAHPGAARADSSTPDAPLAFQGYLRVVDAVTGQVDQALSVSIDGGGDDRAGWSQATAWSRLSPGSHQLVIAVGAATTTTSINVNAGCRVTVLAVRRDATSPQLTTTPAFDCSDTPIPRGQARITTVLPADTDFGRVRAQIGNTSVPANPLSPTPAVLTPAGPTTVAIGAPTTAETFLSTTAELADGTAYTLLWAGGGETPSTLVVLLDAVQAANPPGPNIRIQTGEAVEDFTDPPHPNASSDPSPPVRIQIGAAGLDHPVGAMPTSAIPGLPRNLALNDVDWLAGSTPVGQLGTTALIGHTTSTGRGGFASLENVRPGNDVAIIDANGRVWHYRVLGSETFRKDSFPTSVWAPQPVPSLALITCTRTTNPTTGMADNRIIWATLNNGPEN